MSEKNLNSDLPTEDMSGKPKKPKLNRETMLRLMRSSIPSDEELNKMSIERHEKSKKNPNQFSFWYPTLQKLGVLTPRTVRIPLSKHVSDLVSEENEEKFRQDSEVVFIVNKIQSVFE